MEKSNSMAIADAFFPYEFNLDDEFCNKLRERLEKKLKLSVSECRVFGAEAVFPRKVWLITMDRIVAVVKKFSDGKVELDVETKGQDIATLIAFVECFFSLLSSLSSREVLYSADVLIRTVDLAVSKEEGR